VTAVAVTADLTDFAVDLACWASERIARVDPANVRTKAHAADPVTDTDIAVESEVRERIAARLPGHALRGEEFGATGPDDARYTWFCDPVDGTTNYANGVNWCSFSLCCWDSGGPLVGVVGDPFRRRVAVGVRGEGSRLLPLDEDYRPVAGAGRALAVRRGSGLGGTVVTTEWLAHVPWPGMLGTIAGLADGGCTVRIMGSSTLSLLQVGLGAAAGCLIGHYSAIDDSAAVLIATEAGAVACGIDGVESVAPAGGILLAAPDFRDDILAAWQSSAPTSPRGSTSAGADQLHGSRSDLSGSA
jgi:fructose-1,6-bisphosphatase/inositol monophosphatase family enzyme